MIEIRKARDGEECQVLYFYYRLVDTMKGTPYCPKWEKGIYPVLSDIAGAIGANTLYIATENHEIIGAFILNHFQGEGYQFVNWQTKDSDDGIAVLHLLATAPACQGKGVGKKLLGKAVEVKIRKILQSVWTHYHGMCQGKDCMRILASSTKEM